MGQDTIDTGGDEGLYCDPRLLTLSREQKLVGEYHSSSYIAKRSSQDHASPVDNLSQPMPQIQQNTDLPSELLITTDETVPL